MSGTVRVERVYPHSAEKVWRALTTPELIERWLMPNDFAPVVGHRFTFTTEPGPGFDGVVHCEVLELVAEARLVLSWKGGPIDTKVVFELEPANGGTRLRVTQTGFVGLRGRLVGLILRIGSRSIYGERLPGVLDSLDPAGPAERASGPDPNDPACMSWHQRWVAKLLELLPTKSR